MKSVPIDSLPDDARVACEKLRIRLTDVLGADLIALWAYGAMTFPDRPSRLSDVDTHAFLSRTPNGEAAASISQIHDSIGLELGIEWDSWYVLECHARDLRPPRHMLRESLVDDAWALHRAHWLGGQYVRLYGCTPADLVRRPSWDELYEALQNELRHIERMLEEGRQDAGHTAFMVWNACRIIYSLETKNVVVSKRAAAGWALDHVPISWHAPIRAAGRVYDGKAEPSDSYLLKSATGRIVATTRDRIGRGCTHDEKTERPDTSLTP